MSEPYKFKVGQTVFYGWGKEKAVVTSTGKDVYDNNKYLVKLNCGKIKEVLEFEISEFGEESDKFCECGAKHVTDKSMRSILHSFWCPSYKNINLE